ncbi:cilia- and flagella-associated protein 206 [Onychostruthus taczanowskii]|uniref:cilia- and flagella-associated protein 206 n=1 Tax=Onychostruthus taczanowskii TaxID=356909 RepID=UPI001B80071A|nr:cilia- and flagella-associated protein 206 [Onychostruthus taczanowskii]
MSGELTQSVIKRIVRQVGLECAAQGQSLSETLVVFMVKAVVLDPRNDFNMDRILTENDMQDLIQLCVTRLLDTTNPSLSTIKMQVYFDMNYANRDELLSEQERVLEGKLAPVVRAITESGPRAQEEVENVYQNIVTYVLLRSGLGSPTDIEAVREVTAALQSVFPQTEMITFISLSKKDKEQQLKDLAMLVTGIRLYNKQCQKGGSCIDDLPGILSEAIPLATQTLDERLNSCQLLAHRYTALLESMQEDPQRFSQLRFFKLKEALFNVRQYEAFLCILQSNAITSAQEVESLDVQFEAAMMVLKNTVQNKTSIESREVFPLFVELSKLWTGFQDEMLLLTFLTNMADNLQQFLEIQSQLFPEEMLTSLLEGVTVKSDVERIKETMGTRVNVSDFMNQEWLFPETTDNFDQLLIQYHGFCAHSIGVKGITLPGNPAIGILKHKEKYYVFSSKEAAYIFAEDPDKFIQLNTEKAKKYAELIQLLELRHQFEYLVPHAQARKASKSLMKPPPKCETGTQTDTHILPPTIVRSYEWNEWELRRKAIKLANLRRLLTHSMQTDLSHMRRENFTQVYLPKDAGTQTKRDNSSNVPKPQIFLKGLRGGSSPTTHMVTVDLTRPLDET